MFIIEKQIFKILNSKRFSLFFNLFWFFSPSHQSFFVFFYQSFFYSSPLGLVTHFLLSSTLFTFLTCFSQLAFLPACSQCCLCCLWSYG